MLGKCFSVLSIISFIFAIFTGNMESLCKSILEGASKSVTICISLIGIMALWSGIMAVLKDSGLIKKLAKLLKPFLKLLFPSAIKNGVANEEIALCVSANILGISNATTPLALDAINKLKKSENDNVASNDMIMLSSLGCHSFCLVPSTVIALRMAMGGQISYEIILPVWICSLACSLLGIILCRIMGGICGDTWEHFCICYSSNCFRGRNNYSVF